MSDEITKGNIEAAEHAVTNARAALDRADQHLQTLRATRASQIYKINIDDVVFDREKRIGKVIAIERAWEGIKPNLKVRLQNKNGEFGDRFMTFYYWEKLTP